MLSKPPVNPLLLSLTRWGMIIFALLVPVTIIYGWITPKDDADETFLWSLGAIIMFFISFRIYRKISAPVDEWNFRNSVSVIREELLTIDDLFTVSCILRNGDTTNTYLFLYFISNQVVYQVHPYEAEKFERCGMGPGSIVKVKLIEEHHQLKVVNFELVSLHARPFSTGSYHATGFITEKYCGLPPQGINGDLTPNFTGVVRDPRLLMDVSVNIHPVFKDGRIIQAIGTHPDQYYFRINRHYEKVSAFDFIQFRLGDEVTFVRPEGDGESGITAKVV